MIRVAMMLRTRIARTVVSILMLAATTSSRGAIAYPNPPIEMTKDGWINFQPSADSRAIFVADSGDDRNDGSMEKPVRTARAAQRLARDGYPDWIFFRRGDVFGPLGEWTKSGRSPKEPMVMTAYGTGARPTVGYISTKRNAI